MKKLTVLTMSLAMISMILTGCGANTESAPESSAEPVVQETSAEETIAETSAPEEETKAEETTIEETSAEEENQGEEDDEENYNTGDASLDKVRNEDGIGENELLVVSFGTSFNDSRRQTIGAIEGALDDAFPDYDVRRGFTANIIIDHVQRRDGILIDDVDAALNRAVDNGVRIKVALLHCGI